MASSKPLLFAAVPKKARFACDGLFLMSAIYAVLVGVFLYMVLGSTDPSDPRGTVFLSIGIGYLSLLTVGGSCAAALLPNRNPLGRPIAWVVAILFLLGNPIFFVISVFVMQSLSSADMKRFLEEEELFEEVPDDEVIG